MNEEEEIDVVALVEKLNSYMGHKIRHVDPRSGTSTEGLAETWSISRGIGGKISYKVSIRGSYSAIDLNEVELITKVGIL